MILTPKSETTGDVELKIKFFKDNEDLTNGFKKLFKFDIRAETVGNDMMSPANRHLVKKRGMFAEPVHEVKSAIWHSEFCLFDKDLMFENSSFIKNEDLKTFYLDSGTLKLHLSAAIKTATIVHTF